MANIIVTTYRWVLGLSYLTACLLVLVPFWSIKCLSKSKRPSPGLTWFQAVACLLVRRFVKTLTNFQCQPQQYCRKPLPTTDWIFGRKFVWIPTLQKGERTGVLESAMLQDRKRVPAFWFRTKKAKSTEKSRPNVMLYFHGGAYITFDAGDPFMGTTLAGRLAKHSGMDVLSVNYTLAPDAVFPQQLFEAMSAYAYLIDELQYAPAQIFIGGDSAGANLSLILTRHLLQTRIRPLPAGLVLLSPWVDMTGHRKSLTTNASSCIISEAYASRGWALYHGEIASDNPWMSPIYMDDTELSTFPSMYVSNGQVETLYDEGLAFVEKCQKAGIDVLHNVTPNMPHDFCTLFIFLTQIREVFKDIGKWSEEIKQGHVDKV